MNSSIATRGGVLTGGPPRAVSAYAPPHACSSPRRQYASRVPSAHVGGSVRSAGRHRTRKPPGPSSASRWRLRDREPVGAAVGLGDPWSTIGTAMRRLVAREEQVAGTIEPRRQVVAPALVEAVVVDGRLLVARLGPCDALLSWMTPDPRAGTSHVEPSRRLEGVAPDEEPSARDGIDPGVRTCTPACPCGRRNIRGIRASGAWV
jgi:hypothetical protein